MMMISWLYLTDFFVFYVQVVEEFPEITTKMNRWREHGTGKKEQEASQQLRQSQDYWVVSTT